MVSTPSPPDPMETAQAQGQMNKETAIAQYGLGATNQITPTGNLTYEQTGMWPDETPHYTATQTLSPNQQALLTGGENLSLGMLNVAGNQLGNVSDTLSQPLDLSNSATESYLFNLGRTQLDPYYEDQQAALETQLANQGLAPGSEGYQTSMDNFAKQEADAYNNLLLSGHQTATNDILTQRQEPLNELSALMAGGQVQQPNFQQTPQPGVTPVDYTGLVNQQYQAELQNSQNMMGGLFGLGSTLLGGWMGM